MEIKDVCEYLYNLHRIPIYLYQNRKLEAVFPKEAEVCRPDSDFSLIPGEKDRFLYYFTPEKLFMGYISVPESHQEIFLGPVNSLLYTEPLLAGLLYRRKVRREDHELCKSILQAVPNYTHPEIVDILLLLNYLTTGKKLTRQDYYAYQGEHAHDTASRHLEQEHTEHEVTLGDLKNNEIILRYIEQGNAEAVFDYLCTRQSPPPVSFGKDAMGQRRNLAYYSVALFSDAAQRGGLTTLESTEIAASYYTEITASDDLEHIDLLTGRAALFYAEKVASVHLPMDMDATLLNCIQFIRHNVYSHIQVADIAAYSGYSKTHITRMFRQELGFGPAQLIQRSKLEEARLLLKSTNKSLSEISSDLCFSNQSHFQRSFKKQYHMTPLQFRRNSSSLTAEPV